MDTKAFLLNRAALQERLTRRRHEIGSPPASLLGFAGFRLLPLTRWFWKSQLTPLILRGLGGLAAALLVPLGTKLLRRWGWGSSLPLRVLDRIL